MRFLNKIRLAFTSPVNRCLTRRHMQLFVGGLSYDTNETVLNDAFKDYGEIVEVKVICDRVSGKSRGYGFVRYSSESAATEALKEMNGQLLDGTNIRIHHAHRGGSKEVRAVCYNFLGACVLLYEPLSRMNDWGKSYSYHCSLGLMLQHL